MSVATPVGSISPFDADLPYELHPAVEVRPEPFGALLYSFKTRRLSFLKDPTIGHAGAGAGTAPDRRRRLSSRRHHRTGPPHHVPSSPGHTGLDRNNQGAHCDKFRTGTDQ